MANASDDVKDYRRNVDDIFRMYYDRLNSVLDDPATMKSFASKAHSADIMVFELVKDANFASIFGQFKRGLELYKKYFGYTETM